MSEELSSELIDQAIAGDSRAMQEVLRILRPRVLAYIERKTPSDLRHVLEAQDILQDTWLEAFMRFGQFRPEGSDAVFRWLATIARNHLIDLVRKHRSKKRGGGRVRAMPSAEESMAQLLEKLLIHTRTPSASAASRELVALLIESLQRLPEDQRTALEIRHLQGLNVNEAAAQMGRTAGAVMMLCNRGLKALRVELRSVSSCM